MMSNQVSPTAAAPSSPFDRAMSWGRPIAIGLASAVIVTVAPPVSGLAGLLAVVAPGLGPLQPAGALDARSTSPVGGVRHSAFAVPATARAPRGSLPFGQ